MEKRGQQLSITTLLLIVIGVVVAVVLIIGFTQGFDFIFGKTEFLPGQTLEALVQTCGVAGQNELVADYCKTFKEVELNGRKRFVNCQYSEIENLVGEKKLRSQNSESLCGTEEINAKAYCTGLGDEATRKKVAFDATSVLVNGKSCKGWGVASTKAPE